MPRPMAEWPRYALGAVFLAASVLGGGAASGLWTDSLLQLLVVAAAVPVVASPRGRPVPAGVLLFSAAIVAVMALQLVPAPEALVRLARDPAFLVGRAEAGTVEFASLGLARTLEALIYVAVLVFLFLAFMRLPGEQLHALLPFVLVAVAVGGFAAALQYAGSGGTAMEGLFPFRLHAGFFANRNHLVALLYAAIPPLVYLGTFARMRGWSLLAICALLLVLLAAGSRAGALLGLLALLCSAAFLMSRSRLGLGGILLLSVVAGIYGAGTWNLIETRGLQETFGRLEFAATTLRGITENWLLGVGYGNFVFAYPLYEDPGMVFRSYVNHAHNDFLEIIFEGGLPALVMLAVYGALLLRQMFRARHNHFQKAAFLGIVFVLIHSAVDYPLRTLAVAIPFVYFNAILFHPDLRPQHKNIKALIATREGGRARHIPILG